MSAGKRTLVEDFLPPAECDALIGIQRAYAQPCPSFKPAEEYLQCTWRALSGRASEAELELLDRVRHRIKQEVVDRLGSEEELFIQFTDLTSWHEGVSLNPHVDNSHRKLDPADGRYRWMLNDVGCRKITAILYLNDYQRGGELHFGAVQGLTDFTHVLEGTWETEEVFVPRQGALLVFGAGPENWHRLTTCEAGVRYTLALWLCTDRQQPTEPQSYSHPKK